MIPVQLGAVRLISLLRRLLPGVVAIYILARVKRESSAVDKLALQQIRQELGCD
jgi:hypothetical protein